MEDYNYYRQPALVLRGGSVEYVLKLGCRNVQLDRGSDGHYLADLTMLACGERPGVASSKMKPIQQSTTTTTTPRIPKPTANPTISLEMKYNSINYWSFVVSGVSSWRGSPIEICLIESGAPFAVSRAAEFGIVFESEELFSDTGCRTFDPPEFNRYEPDEYNVYGPKYFGAFLAGDNDEDVAARLCGIDWNTYARYETRFCTTQNFVATAKFQDGSTAVSAPVQMFFLVDSSYQIAWSNCDPRPQAPRSNCVGPRYRVR